MRTWMAPRDSRALPAALVLAALASVSACEGGEQKIDLPEAPTKQVERAVEVPFVEVQRRHVAVPVQATGTTQPLRASNLAPRITSRVEAVLVDEGETVRQGKPLIRLDANAARLRAAEAAARAAQTQAQAGQVASDLARLTPLAKRGSIPEQRIDQLESQQEALDAAAKAARAAAQQAKQDVAESTVRAPFDGRISNVHVEAGEMAVTQPPTTLLRIVDLSEIEVRIPVHERDLARIGVGDAARVAIPSAGRELTAAVSYIRPEIDPRTRTAEVVVRFDNPDDAVLAGMFAEVHIDPSTEREALIVPRTAIGRAGDERFVYTVEEGRAHRKRVEVQELDEQRVEVLSGLESGTRIVAGDLDRLSEGVAVREAANEPAPTSQKAPEREAAQVAEKREAP